MKPEDSAVQKSPDVVPPQKREKNDTSPTSNDVALKLDGNNMVPTCCLPDIISLQNFPVFCQVKGKVV